MAAVILLGAWLLGCLAAALWQFHRPAPLRLAAMLATLAAAGAWAAWSWWRTPSGTLTWDGQNWTWSARSEGDAASVEVALDLQRALLLRWNAGDASQWIWLHRNTLAERWDDLRRAVYSRARPKALQQARGPAAKP